MNPRDRDLDPHDRTHRLGRMLGVAPQALRQLSRRRIALEISHEVAKTRLGCLAYLTIANLATRLGPYAPVLHVFSPESAPALVGAIYDVTGSLNEQALLIMRAAVPTEHIERASADLSREYDLAITIGEPQIRAKERIYVGWEDWLGITSVQGLGLRFTDGRNPFGALLASAMVVAKLHAVQLRAIGAAIPFPFEDWILNACNLSDGRTGPQFPEVLSAPKTLLVGAGALGCTFVYALIHVLGLMARVDCVDPDVLRPSNANRQITAVFEVAREGKTLKVDNLAAVWPAVRPYPMTYDDYKRTQNISAGDYKIAVSAVDNLDARRQVAHDLPMIQIDGATGGLMIALMRGADPANSCVACEYAEILTDEDVVWAERLGTSRERIGELRSGDLSFSDLILQDIEDHGTYPLDEEAKAGLLKEGWKYLERARCGTATPERGLPSASVSYVSALCGFLMAAQFVAELLGVSALSTGQNRWAWDDVLRDAPKIAEHGISSRSQTCAARHELRRTIYKAKWNS